MNDRLKGHKAFHHGTDKLFAHIQYCDRCGYSMDYILRTGKKCKSRGRFVPYEKHLKKELKDPVRARAYLYAALEDQDPRTYILACQDVAKAQEAKP